MKGYLKFRGESVKGKYIKQMKVIFHKEDGSMIQLVWNDSAKRYQTSINNSIICELKDVTDIVKDNMPIKEVTVTEIMNGLRKVELQVRTASNEAVADVETVLVRLEISDGEKQFRYLNVESKITESCSTYRALYLDDYRIDMNKNCDDEYQAVLYHKGDAICSTGLYAGLPAIFDFEHAGTIFWIRTKPIE